jgi:hypothetical protein
VKESDSLRKLPPTGNVAYWGAYEATLASGALGPLAVKRVPVCESMHPIRPFRSQLILRLADADRAPISGYGD